jgi:hypothetical protein
LWALVHGELKKHTDWPTMGGPSFLKPPWSDILFDMHVRRDGSMADDFASDPRHHVQSIRRVFEHGNYVQVFGWLQYVMRHPKRPYQFHIPIDQILRQERAAYRVVDASTIMPIGSEAELATIKQAFADVAAAEFRGARSHLRKASDELTAGRYADSIRESIHAVEATARVLEPSAALSTALGRLEQSAKIHKALKQGFGNLYGYTSDEKGIRHPLLDDGTAKVDETDATFMIGACAAFVSYLINKARAAGLFANSK